MASTTPVDSNAVVQAYGYVQLLEAQLEEKQSQLDDLNNQAATASSNFDYWNSIYTRAAATSTKTKTFWENAQAAQAVLKKMVSFYAKRIIGSTEAAHYGTQAANAIMEVTNTMREYASDVETSVNLAKDYNASETNTALHFTDQVFLNNYSSADSKGQDTLKALTQASLDALATVWAVNKLKGMIQFFEGDLVKASETIDQITNDAETRYQLALTKSDDAEVNMNNSKEKKADADEAAAELVEEIALLEEMIKVAKSGLVTTAS